VCRSYREAKLRAGALKNLRCECDDSMMYYKHCPLSLNNLL